MEREFFDWLESIGELDKYEALLDISEDYVIDQTSHIRASEELDEIRSRYKEENFRLNKIKKLKYNIDKKNGN